ncbi:hypothetical protein VTL71DRAFT_8724 [Oculimacula yallundae]|uniref:ferric-chelate reductase (NADPH) n=1 Tax=Oculimacula yallundae TaxID=86028 RepID=A0ABR4D0T8_9HELO
MLTDEKAVFVRDYRLRRRSGSTCPSIKSVRVPPLIGKKSYIHKRIGTTMSSSSASNATTSSDLNINTTRNTTYLPLTDSRCNSTTCLAFKAAQDASQAEIPFASQFVYGHYMVFYYCTLVLLFSILHAYRRLSRAYNFIDDVEPESEPELKARPTIWQKTKAVYRFISYGILRFGFQIPITQAIFLVLGVIFTAILTIQQKHYFRPRLSYGSPPLGVRTGVMALSLMPAIVALCGKYNSVTLLTGISYEKLNLFHRWLGWMCFALGMVHSLTFAVAIWRDENCWPLMEKVGVDEYTGLVTLIILTLITILGMPYIRRHFYEFFASSHIIFYILYLVILFWHTANRQDTWTYLYVTLAITVISSLGRLILKTKIPCSATIQDLDGEMLRLTIPAFDSLTWKPGQHVYLRFVDRGRGLRWWENHPFTIASLCEETFVTDKMGISSRTPLVFLIKSRKGLTKRLLKVAQQRETLKVVIEGPYGGNDLDLKTGYEQIILVAGGSGISAILPLFSMLCKRSTKRNSRLRSVRLVWVVRYRSALAWVREEIKIALKVACPGVVEIDLYVTEERNGKEQLTFSFENENIEMQSAGNEELKMADAGDEEERLIPEADDILNPIEKDSDECLSIDDLELEMGMHGETTELTLGVDHEDAKLIPLYRQVSRLPMQDPDVDYGIEVSISYGRPDFPDVLPRLFPGGGRICVIGCGPEEMNVSLSNAVANCQTRVLRGIIREVTLRTETFGW